MPVTPRSAKPLPPPQQPDTLIIEVVQVATEIGDITGLTAALAAKQPIATLLATIQAAITDGTLPVILTAPDTTKYQIGVDNAGVLTTSLIP